VTDYTPSARPGGRAPHVSLARNGTAVSTIDLVGRRFTLLASGEAWRDAAAAVAVPLDVATIGDADLRDPDGAWHATYGIERGGAVLVRPDGYVGWRTRRADGDRGAALQRAIAQIVGR
jgi:putative polyketide hydroxylase